MWPISYSGVSLSFDAAATASNVPLNQAQALDLLLMKASSTEAQYDRQRTRPAKSAVELLFRAAMEGVSGSPNRV